MDNQDLIIKIKQGDNEAFNLLVKNNLTMILNFVYRFVYDVNLAEDITQETFIKI
ncbi:MAG TPA: sigma factor [Candidatus Paceibacterota bacterium]|jgi:RNA polymerase sigma-70 factor (ECF subfamily)|nr:sigma factor [Candidatus Paceibacterota bacterium]HRZ29714.1 sigma factor [Candidatus Paceibacterota bacterium]